MGESAGSNSRQLEAKSSLLFDRTTFLGAKLRVSESDVDWSELPEDDGNESPPSLGGVVESYDVVERPPPPRRAAARSGAAGGGRHRCRAAAVLVALRVLLDDAEPINSPAATIASDVGLAVLAM